MLSSGSHMVSAGLGQLELLATLPKDDTKNDFV
jgi:hypothetical protein